MATPDAKVARPRGHNVCACATKNAGLVSFQVSGFKGVSQRECWRFFEG
jgi:hypothetical protein